MDKKYSLSNLSQAPKIFKIVVNPQEDKLRIPTGFIRKYGQTLADSVALRAPNGTVRQVELVQLDGETWLHNGWEKFKDYYGIQFGHLLVFEYDGESYFDVFIFDMTALEIEYPLDAAAAAGEDDQVSEMEVVQVDESESDDSAGILNKAVWRSKRRGVKGQISKKKATTTMSMETNAAYQRATAFKPNNPFFIFLLQPSYITYRSNSIPVAFARKHLPEPKNQLRLHVQKKGTWTVNCFVVPSKARMSNGWSKFVRENALKAGDVCVFEVNKRDKLLWNVTIFRS